ncbi:uncharacterized protein [Aegilops tauschii subsp. strangulata]|uniref:uncharacterized protein n=1 Tax=Aegilops tauschii subsp. strangulata TaxID=200361 RepID=UPI003CC88670
MLFIIYMCRSEYGITAEANQVGPAAFCIASQTHEPASFPSSISPTSVTSAIVNNKMHSTTFPAVKRRCMSPSQLPPATRCTTSRDVCSGAYSWPAWESLHADLVCLVASALLARGDLLDYVRFRAVCAHWRSATLSPRGRGVVDPCFHPRRWMMFPEDRGLYPGHPELGGYIRFFNLDSGAFVRVCLPLFRNHCILDSVCGLLLLQRDKDAAIRLLHPFTRDIVELPRLTTLATQMPGGTNWSLQRMRFISTCASFVAGVVTVLLTFNMFDGVAVATSLDMQWTMLSWECPAWSDPVSLHGKLYVVDIPEIDVTGSPLIFELDAAYHHRATPKLIFTCPREKRLYSCYLVEHGSEILVVCHDDDFLSHITVYRLADLVLGKFIPVTDIGENTIFMGQRNICVSSKAFPTVEANTIVYYRPIKNRFAQYHIRTKD